MNSESRGRTLSGGVLAVALLLAFGLWLPLFVIPTIEDVIAAQLMISHARTALTYTTPVAVLALVAIPGGILADRVGLKKTIGVGAVRPSGASRPPCRPSLSSP
jgi:MFS family permease